MNLFGGREGWGMEGGREGGEGGREGRDDCYTYSNRCESIAIQ